MKEIQSGKETLSLKTMEINKKTFLFGREV
jgi:hypothetical protein